MGCKKRRPRSPPTELNSNHVAKSSVPRKRICLGLGRLTDQESEQQSIQQPVLSLYFPRLLTLRSYLTEVLASTQSGSHLLRKLQAIDIASDQELTFLLDSTLVGFSKDNGNNTHNTQEEIAAAIQKSSGRRSCLPQSEVVDLVLQILFYRSYRAPKQLRHAVFPGKPNHILCLGYTGDRQVGWGPFNVQAINRHPNSHVNTLKSQQWDRLLRVIGEETMFELLLETSIFVLLAQDKQIYYQLCGPPIADGLNTPAVFPVTTGCRETSKTSQGLKRSTSDIGHAAKKVRKEAIVTGGAMKNATNVPPDRKSHGEIVFVRSRVFYARPSHNKKQEVQFGLPHIHALNRFPDSMEDARCLLVYLFPRQYGLHNVFTSEVNKRETTQAFQDYTIRREIDALKENRQGKKPKEFKDLPIPRRLKDSALRLVVHMQKLHQRCSYHALVKYYCPSSLCDPGVRDKRIRLHAQVNSLEMQAKVNSSLVQPTGTAPALNGVQDQGVGCSREQFTDFASSSGEVSGFVRAVIGRVIPNEFFGCGGTNRDSVMRTVDFFVKMRRYESFSLHESLQGLKLTDFGWLRPHSIRPNEKMSRTDEAKRRQLLSEFMYWLFDSFVIPLLRAHFYITESSVDRNRIFYFRHDAWEKLSKPALESLKINMFEEMGWEHAENLLASRKLGFSQIRLLPKERGIRTITNLKRKRVKMVNGKIKLTPGINTIMTPVYRVMLLEKERKPERIGNSIFSVTEMYPRIKEFKKRIDEKGWAGQKLYFAKVDVQACFDTIPQSKLLCLVRSFMAEENEYNIASYAEVRPPPPYQVPSKNGSKRPERRFLGRAKPADIFDFFADFAQTLKKVTPGTVLVDDVQPKNYETAELIQLLESHIQQNIIKIGRKYFKQKAGIPQGSILSSILCSFFYAELEREKLSFTKSDDSLLLRLIDDFLLITLDRNKAIRFLTIMHSGNPEYGAFVRAEKSLVNFETTILEKKMVRLVGTLKFPYCRAMIHTKTLNISKERERRRLINIDNTLTVDYSRRPGGTLLRKTVASFKILAHDMYFDTELNSTATVVENIYHAFVESAMKFHRYVKSLRKTKTVAQMQLVVCVKELLGLAWVMIRERQNGKAIARANVVWLGAHAFRKVLSRKQSGYKLLLKWLGEAENADGRRPVGISRSKLGLEAFEAYRY